MILMKEIHFPITLTLLFMTDVFTNDLVYPKNSSGDKQVSKYV